MLRKYLIALVCSCFVSAALAEITCVTCDSSTNPECITKPSSITAENCDSDNCYTQIANGIVSRGCFNSTTAATECKGVDCILCKTNKCNIEYTICQTCDSSTNAECAQLTTANNAFSTICTSENAQCYVGLSDEKTIRRCAQPADASTCTADSKTCELCTGSNCNSNIYPSNRLTCYQCEDTSTSTSTSCSNPTLQASALTAQACANYAANDSCYTYATSATAMQRGCVSDTKNENCAKDSTNALCATCNSNSCNSRTYTYPPALTCVQCNSKDTPSCADAQAENTAKSCEDIPYTAVGQCYSEMQNGIVYRGCLAARNTSLGECTTENNCNICDASNGCNNAAVKTTGITCIQCRSDNDVSCLNPVSPFTGVECTGTQCYEIWFNNLYLRGCFENALPQVKLICQEANNNVCQLCSTNNCNINKAGNGASLNAIARSLSMLLVLIALNTIY